MILMLLLLVLVVMDINALNSSSGAFKRGKIMQFNSESTSQTYKPVKTVLHHRGWGFWNRGVLP